MKYLGVDFGEKNIGLSKSDSFGKISFAFKILNNDKNLKKNFLKILETEKIKKIIFGKSLNFQMKKNKINQKMELFLQEIKPILKKKKISWDFENEFFTSMEAKQIQIKNLRRFKKEERFIKDKKKKTKKKNRWFISGFNPKILFRKKIKK